ncbi:MAG: hypothetical protein LBM38_02505 [Clostridiales bacterium]|jgi:hypothetical protein|nr:hypothetical protein [Clostridiales bacterium]
MSDKFMIKMMGRGCRAGARKSLGRSGSKSDSTGGGLLTCELLSKGRILLAGRFSSQSKLLSTGGFSLVEIIVAMTLLIVIISVVSSSYFMSLTMNTKTRQRVEATRVANMYLETAKSLDPDDYGEIIPVEDSDLKVQYNVDGDEVTVTVYDAEGNVIEGIPNKTKQW